MSCSDLDVSLENEIFFVFHDQNLRNTRFRTLGFVLKTSDDVKANSALLLDSKYFVCLKIEYAALIWSQSILTTL